MYQRGRHPYVDWATCALCNTTPPPPQQYGDVACTPCNTTPPPPYGDVACIPCNTTQPTQYTGITRESIAELKRLFEQKIAELDEYAKNLGPKTAEEIDKREKELKAELDDLAKRRKSLKDSK